MSWLQIDDNMTDHPKIAALSDAAFRDHMEGLSYCARLLTDGFIPTKNAAEITTKTTLKQLTDGDKPLWESVPGGYQIHDYLDYNPSKEQVLAKRAARAKAGSAGGRARASNSQAKSQANGKQMLEQTPSKPHSIASPPLLSNPSDGYNNQEDSTETPAYVAILLRAMGEHERSQAHMELLSFHAKGASEFDFRQIASAVERRRPDNPRSYVRSSFTNRLRERA